MESEVSALDVSKTVEVFVGVLMDAFSNPNDPTMLVFRSCTNLLTCIGRRVLIPSSSPTLVLDLTPTTPTLPRSAGRMYRLRAWIACCRESHTQ
eukprot:6182294-Pleurochrysis_carterae.AAC.4